MRSLSHKICQMCDGQKDKQRAITLKPVDRIQFFLLPAQLGIHGSKCWKFDWNPLNNEWGV